MECLKCKYSLLDIGQEPCSSCCNGGGEGSKCYYEPKEKKVKKKKMKFNLPSMLIELCGKDNKNLKFQRLSDGLIIEADKDGTLRWESGHEYLNVEKDRFILYQEPKPVSFMEAVKAYAEGKSIRCECDDRVYFYKAHEYSNSFYEMTSMFNGHISGGLSVKEILEGKWFIEEDVE